MGVKKNEKIMNKNQSDTIFRAPSARFSGVDSILKKPVTESLCTNRKVEKCYPRKKKWRIEVIVIHKGSKVSPCNITV